MANIFQIGTSALTAAQAGISTAGQNIANVSTAGYSRQTVNQTAVKAQPLGFGYLGQGVEVTEVRRLYNEFLVTQQRGAESTAAGAAIQSSQLALLDNLLANPDAGLSPALQDFFASLQTLSTQPADSAPRQAVLSAAEVLVSRFHDTAQAVSSLGIDLQTQMKDSLSVINQLASKISGLNDAIDRAQSLSNGLPANDLLDQREQALRELAREARVSVTQQGNRLNVYLGNGQPLVVDSSVYQLEARVSNTDPGRLEVAYAGSGDRSALTGDNLVGGRLGGLLSLRDQVYTPTQNAVDRLALSLAGALNAAHAQGVTQSGQPGAPLFALPSPLVTAGRANTGSGVLSASITDPSLVQASDYRLSRVGDTYQLVRGSDLAVLASGSSLSAVLAAASADGFSLSLAAGTQLDPGDEFLIRPSAGAASQIQVALSNPGDLAAGRQAGLAGDNRNLLAMLALQSAPQVAGRMSFQSAYAQLVSQVGSQSREFQMRDQSAQAVLTQASNAVQQVSGVNLDEEAADLIRYQQAYQAAGKVLQMAQQMFDSLLNMSK